MFVRINSTPNSPRKSVQIVESGRVGDKVSKKILRHVGIATNDYEQDRLVACAHDIMTEMKQKLVHPELFNNLESDVKRGRKKKKQLVDILPAHQVALTDVREESRIIEG